jgi:uncharacterized protein (TIGR03435 family)
MAYTKLPFIALAAVSATTLLAQDITGTWQGALAPPNGKELRRVFKISKDAKGLGCLYYSIDERPQPWGCSITIASGTLRISVPSGPANYEGKLTSAGTDIYGTWMANGSSLNLNLQHVNDDAAWPLPELPAAPKAMAKDADPAFDAASIKPADPGQRGRLFQMPGREFRALNASAGNLAEWSYGVHERQIIGAPAWFEADKYNITATPDLEGKPSVAQWQIMVQKLLADRFQLKFHRETRELPVYTITLAKGGPRLTKSAGDPNAIGSVLFPRGGTMNARNASVADVAGGLQRAVLDRQVVDQTGVQGKWDIVLQWRLEGNQMQSLGAVPRPVGDVNPDPDGPPDLVLALQDQLGLKLSAGKAMVEVLVVDHVEKPSGN